MIVEPSESAFAVYFYSTVLWCFYTMRVKMLASVAVIQDLQRCFNVKKQSYAATSVFLDRNTALLHTFTIV